MTKTATDHVTFTEHMGPWPPKKATAFIAWIQAKLDEIPEPYRKTATIEFYGDPERCGNEITLRWKRPETAEEAESRRVEAEYRRKNPHLRRPWW